MNPIVLLRDLLQSLPPKVRGGIYAAVVLLGAAALVCQHFGVSAVGPVDVDTVREVLEYVAPALGLTALANLSRIDHGTDETAAPTARATRRMSPAPGAARDRLLPSSARRVARRRR